MEPDEVLPGFIDSHFHIREMGGKGIDVIKEIETSIELGMTAGIDVAVDLEDLQKRSAIIDPYPEIGSSTGLAPFEADSGEISSKVSRLEEVVAQSEPLAIGEIGLDWHWNYGTRERQIELFQAQLSLARQFHLPVIIHNRLADADMIEILGRSAPDRGGIMHCFSSGYDAAKAFVDYGFLISFAGNVTYKRAEAIQEAAARLPVEAILCETDSPYLAPHPVRGELNVPSNVRYIYSFIAGLRDESTESFTLQIGRNFRSLFGADAKKPSS